MSDPNTVVAVDETHTDTEQAVAKLSAAPIDIKKVSIIGKDYHTEENVVGYSAPLRKGQLPESGRCRG